MFSPFAIGFLLAVGGTQVLSLLPGTMLPAALEHTLDARHLRGTKPIALRLLQRVPLENNTFLPGGAQILGTAECDGKTLKLSFTELHVHKQTLPLLVRLVAAADWLDVEQTKVPLGSPDRGTANPAQWTTMQIGRDEVYLSNAYGTVYDRYSRAVGRADGTGVYAPPPAAGGPERAMGPFSTTASGLYDLPGLTLVPNTGAAVLRIDDLRWQMHAHDALLLEVVAP